MHERAGAPAHDCPDPAMFLRGHSILNTRMPGTSTVCVLFLPCAREHMVIHPDHHGDSHDSVVKKMKWHSRNAKGLHKTHRHHCVKPVMVRGRLNHQNQVLDVMPEL